MTSDDAPAKGKREALLARLKARAAHHEAEHAHQAERHKVAPTKWDRNHAKRNMDYHAKRYKRLCERCGESEAVKALRLRFAAIKAMRMRLAAKKVPGHAKQGRFIAGRVVSRKPWDESLHPRVGGKFASKPGGAAKQPDAPARSPQAASLREQAAAHRAKKGTRKERLESVLDRTAQRHDRVSREARDSGKTEENYNKRILAAESANTKLAAHYGASKNKDLGKGDELRRKADEAAARTRELRQRAEILRRRRSRISDVARTAR